MTFTPASSLASGGAGGHVTVDNFPATQLVSGTVTADQGAAGVDPWPVSAATTERTLGELAQTAENTELVLRLYASKMLETDLTEVVP